MLSRYQLELATAGAMFVLGTLALAGALEHETGWAAGGPQAGYFPFRLGLIIMAASMAVAAQAWWNRAAQRRSVIVTQEAGRRVLAFAGPVLAFVTVSQWLGLYVATALYLTAVLRWQGKRSWATSLAVALGSMTGAYVVFERWFQVPLLKGPIEAWLSLA